MFNSVLQSPCGIESQEQAIALSILDYSAPDTSGNSLEQVPIFWARALAGETVRFEWKCKRPKDGSYFDAEITINKITLNGKDVMLSSVQDISEQQAALRERKQAELVLQQSEIQLRQQSAELVATLRKLQNTQAQLIQSEKMSSLGQLQHFVAW